MNKSQVRITRRRTDKNFRGAFDYDGAKIKSSGKRANRNNSKLEKNVKINSPKRVTKPQGFPSLKIQNRKTSNFNKINLKLKDGSSSNLLSISDEIEEPCFSAHKKKEAVFFRVGKSDEKQVTESYYDNKRLLSDILKTQNKQMLIDSSFSSEDVGDTTFKDRRHEELKAQTNSLSTRKVHNKTEIHPKEIEIESLKGFYFMPFKNNKVEMVEILPWEVEVKVKSKFKTNSTSKNPSILPSKGNKLSSTQSRYRNKEANASAVLSRNNSNIVIPTASIGRTDHKHHPASVFLQKPIRTLREVFKSIRSDIKKHKKMKKIRPKSSNSTLSERSVEFEDEEEKEEKDWDSEYELEMEQEQRKIIELRMIDMIKCWNDMYKKPSDRTDMKFQFDCKNKPKNKSKPRSSIKFSRGTTPTNPL